jgi:hypothetical protein
LVNHLRRHCLAAICFALNASAHAQSVVLAAPSASVNAEQGVAYRGELHPLKPHFERQAKRAAVATSKQPVVSDEVIVDGSTATLPTIEVTGQGDVIRPQQALSTRIAKGVDGAFSGPVRVGQPSVIGGAPPIGAGFAAWTDPGNIHFWLR